MLDERTNDNTTLYKQYDSDGTLLYVGVTRDVHKRLIQHGCHSPWWKQVQLVKLEHFNSHDEAIKAERNAVINEKPLWNEIHRPVRRFPPGFAKLKWNKEWNYETGEWEE